MTRCVGIGEFRRQASQLIEACRRDGESCVITSHGKPLAVVVPWEAGVSVQCSRGDEYAGAHRTESEPPHPSGECAALEQIMDSATWGQWEGMSDEDRAAMVLAQSLIKGALADGDAGAPPVSGWAGYRVQH